MNASNWTATADSLSPTGALVLVAGWNADTPNAELVYRAARLVNDDAATDEAGHAVEVWADDVHMEELTFTPTHWQPIQAPARRPS
ncbi:hypothetical protein [Roseateles saccharophilus]|uniref:DUF551 domain-containing protein n=1 Tax=Roseateles saccharophilus TaxID=304 RepID=A0A4R3V576_ROSSA|nr:hypothetical protein [Roseateles saccharophilus]MDG0835133.1 hypothetical protein [Roseateles saccharophilus]TCU98732.1 hypothetical protein EV671_10094 [Roseateles saccharophilus]